MEKVTNDHGQTVIRLKHPSGALCEVYLFGATITKFVTASGRDVIWVSSTARLDGTKAIRGGIPLVFPHFGTPIKDMAQHGFARNNLWTLEGDAMAVEGTEDLRCVFSLDNKVATHEAWAHPYRLEYSVTLGAETLATTLTVHNVGEQPFSFMDLQHTYINVGDVISTSVSGLQGVQYFDKASDDPDRACTDERQAANVGEFTDRIYFPTESKPIPDPVVIVSPLGNISLSKKAAATTADGPVDLPVDTVLWNPWAEKGAGMPDFEEDGHLRMLCVEPGLVKGFQTLAPKASASLTQILSTTI
mmetsp:Transcript_4795/g.13974  ORF Transcript_4795/g.13974 Transcript_4795/m.13974 type:complete len:303 (-) Transcript_4795:93-1001(-)